MSTTLSGTRIKSRWYDLTGHAIVAHRFSKSVNRNDPDYTIKPLNEEFGQHFVDHILKNYKVPQKYESTSSTQFRLPASEITRLLEEIRKGDLNPYEAGATGPSPSRTVPKTPAHQEPNTQSGASTSTAESTEAESKDDRPFANRVLTISALIDKAKKHKGRFVQDEYDYLVSLIAQSYKDGDYGNVTSAIAETKVEQELLEINQTLADTNIKLVNPEDFTSDLSIPKHRERNPPEKAAEASKKHPLSKLWPIGSIVSWRENNATYSGYINAYDDRNDDYLYVVNSNYLPGQNRKFGRWTNVKDLLLKYDPDEHKLKFGFWLWEVDEIAKQSFLKPGSVFHADGAESVKIYGHHGEYYRAGQRANALLFKAIIEIIENGKKLPDQIHISDIKIIARHAGYDSRDYDNILLNYFSESKSERKTNVSSNIPARPPHIQAFIDEMHAAFTEGTVLHKRDLEKIGKKHGITLVTELYEYAEYAWVLWYRKIFADGKHLYNRNTFDAVVNFYQNIQPTYSLRDSVRTEFQQYSTAAPLAYAAQWWVDAANADMIFEPSAGNGLLLFTAPYKNTVVNELDPTRLEILKYDPWMKVLSQDAEDVFTEYNKRFDAVLTNPPFGRLAIKSHLNNYELKTLDGSMTYVALEAMQDNGRGAIIIGGHTRWNDNGQIQSHRPFFNWLFHHYHVTDMINVDGKLYSKQGTAANIRLLLINGRKAKPAGFAPIVYDEGIELTQEVKSWPELYQRVQKSISNVNWLLPQNQDKYIFGQSRATRTNEVFIKISNIFSHVKEVNAEGKEIARIEFKTKERLKVGDQYIKNGFIVKGILIIGGIDITDNKYTNCLIKLKAWADKAGYDLIDGFVNPKKSYYRFWVNKKLGKRFEALKKAYDQKTLNIAYLQRATTAMKIELTNQTS